MSNNLHKYTLSTNHLKTRLISVIHQSHKFYSHYGNNSRMIVHLVFVLILHSVHKDCTMKQSDVIDIALCAKANPSGCYRITFRIALTVLNLSIGQNCRGGNISQSINCNHGFHSLQTGYFIRRKQNDP